MSRGPHKTKLAVLRGPRAGTRTEKGKRQNSPADTWAQASLVTSAGKTLPSLWSPAQDPVLRMGQESGKMARTGQPLGEG